MKPSSSVLCGTHAGYNFCFDQQLLGGCAAPAVIDQLVPYLEQVPARTPERGALSGRSGVQLLDLHEVGRAVLKYYCRGGLIGRVVKRTYLNYGTSRPQAEFELLRRVRALNVKVPHAIGYGVKGGLFYRGWLLTSEITSPRSLEEIVRADEEQIQPLMQTLHAYVAQLIRNRIQHVDLHPGNVLLDSSGELYIIDFDKARHYCGRLNRLRDFYLCRWRRAVLKHELPEILAELFTLGLRTNFEESAEG
jgi:3-deoxy-D-manno-octulosonic acid kinase